MKKIHGLLILLISFTQVSFGQTVEEIINKHIDAMGGKEKILTLSSALMTGTFTTMGASPINITTTKKHLVGSRIDIEANGTNNYQVITPEKGWIYTPVQGDKQPRPLNDEQFKVAQVQLDMQGPFIKSVQKGYKIEADGKDTVNGSMCNKLKVTAPNKNVTVYFIDIRSNFIVKSTTKVFQFGALEEVATFYGDYKQNEDGYWFAYTNAGPRGTTHYEKITTNVPVDNKIFKVE